MGTHMVQQHQQQQQIDPAITPLSGTIIIIIFRHFSVILADMFRSSDGRRRAIRDGNFQKSNFQFFLFFHRNWFIVKIEFILVNCQDKLRSSNEKTKCQ